MLIIIQWECQYQNGSNKKKRNGNGFGRIPTLMNISVGILPRKKRQQKTRSSSSKRGPRPMYHIMGAADKAAPKTKRNSWWIGEIPHAMISVGYLPHKKKNKQSKAAQTKTILFSKGLFANMTTNSPKKEEQQTDRKWGNSPR